MKIIHVISGLIGGGAETTLYRLLEASRFENEVVSLTEIGMVGEQIRQLGVPVRSLGMRGFVSNATAIARLAVWLRRGRPDVVQTWLHHADLVGGLAARLGTTAPVLWNLRHSEFLPGMDKRTTLWTVRACAALSRRIPSKILCCSHASRSSHARLGYPLERMQVVHNGFNLATFRPDPSARSAIRDELGVSAEEVLIGVIGNNRPEKDFPNLLAAAARLCATRAGVRFVLCGAELDWSNEALSWPIRALGLTDRFSLVGLRRDVARIAAALDIGCSPSASEGLPNAIGEAMACGVPCVVTDVGDSALLVGETGLVVPRYDDRALASALRDLVDAGAERRREFGVAARRRIASEFSFRAFVDRYHEIYEESSRARAGRFPVVHADIEPGQPRDKVRVMR